MVHQAIAATAWRIGNTGPYHSNIERFAPQEQPGAAQDSGSILLLVPASV